MSNQTYYVGYTVKFEVKVETDDFFNAAVQFQNMSSEDLVDLSKMIDFDCVARVTRELDNEFREYIVLDDIEEL